MVRFPSFIAASVALILRVAASPAPDITIYRPHPDLPGTTEIISDSVIGASVFGVDNGITRYIISAVESFEALGNSFSTQTLLTTPQTLTFTIEENESIYNALAIQTLTVDGEVVVDNVVVQCTADPFGGDANCIQIETVSGTGLPAGGIATTTRYLAGTTAIFTITDGHSAATPTATTPGGVVSQVTIKPSGGSSSNGFPVPTASSGAMQLRAGGVYLSGFILFAVLFFVRWG